VSGARLVLWDIDGTLVRSGDIGAEVFDRALELALGRPPASRIRMGGKTDPQIVREYLELMEVDGAEDHLPVVLRHLEEQLAEAAHLVAEKGQVLPGAGEVLERLAQEPQVIQSVLTGNIAPNAVVKLKAFGLDRWLDLEIGAYGSDQADRKALVPIALERVRRLRGQVLGPDQVWVVGDTERDLEGARASGTRCLLVATGRSALAELSHLGADAVLADLSDTEAVTTLLLT
jgi:phosphoglycolate phosphatase